MSASSVQRSRFDPVFALLAKAHARHQYNLFMKATRQAGLTQDKCLLQKLRRNADSDYGRAYGFSTIRTYADFIRRVPIQTYDDLRPFVDRVMTGDTGALFGAGQKVLMFAMTSGSTDAPKYIPITKAFVNEYRRGWNIFGLKALMDHENAFLRPLVQVSSPMDETRAPCGVPCGSISGLLAKSQKKLVRRFYISPANTGYIGDASSRYYTIMRFAVPADVGWMVTASPATQLKLARAAAGSAERLIRDVHDGSLRPPGAPGDNPEVIESLRERLEPDRAAAQRLERLLESHGELLPRHYWNLAFLANWTGGSMALHTRDFPHYFGDTPVRDIGLLATEGRASICLEDGTPAAVLDVQGSFFEFVEVGADGEASSTVLRCHEVVPDRTYRLIMTTSAGFYRYDIGDHVRVHRLLGEAPLIEFLHRGAHTSSITGEKLTEWQVTTAFERVRRRLEVAENRFVLAARWNDPPHYVLHIGRHVRDAERLACDMDDQLCAMNPEYASKRKSARLGPVVVNRLPEGALADWDADRQCRRGPANEQFKPPYLLGDSKDEESLLARCAPARDAPGDRTAGSPGLADSSARRPVTG